MKIYYLFVLFIIIERIKLIVNENINETKPYNLENRDFKKDIEELDLSGLEDDIENIEEIANKDNYSYITQIYVYVRIDNEYEKYLNHLEFMKLGEKYMTLLQNAMLHVQLKKTGKGIFTCYYENKAITEDLATYFLIQKEIDFIEVGFDKRFPEGRNSPIIDIDKRTSKVEKNEEL
ncbi:conserved Plasmodium protein, unknown function [Plasmodium gallinaceum]|uniref:Uncharacterized protein n=1 Tax=Plasmodium gallinaceum TaxID=5849 RepID=A0A1J1GSP7_PLAGA|nr:conserved Plasmodium protein, unknown function [Plasmodium gallinaceum]CRG95318.1 conserved Plasmodium protein, unknown function [Plasmodium gallinaceum]